MSFVSFHTWEVVVVTLLGDVSMPRDPVGSGSGASSIQRTTRVNIEEVHGQVDGTPCSSPHFTVMRAERTDRFPDNLRLTTAENEQPEASGTDFHADSRLGHLRGASCSSCTAVEFWESEAQHVLACRARFLKTEQQSVSNRFREQNANRHNVG